MSVGRPVGFRIHICPKGHDKRVSGRYKGGCRVCRIEAQRAFAQSNPSIVKLRSYKAHAKERGLSFDLTDDQFFSLVSNPCYYCGGYALKLNGVDRVDNATGYTVENSVSCCKFCNIAKHDRSCEDFEQWILRAADHLRSR